VSSESPCQSWPLPPGQLQAQAMKDSEQQGLQAGGKDGAVGSLEHGDIGTRFGPAVLNQ